MVVSKNKKDVFEIIGNKPVPYGSKKVIVPGLFFSAAMVRKEMISLHLMPIYYHEKEFEPLMPTMIKCLKGKACFNFKKPEEVNRKELNAVLKKGMEMWKKNGYMK